MNPDLQARYDALRAYYAAHPDEARRDAEAIRHDWRMVGGDMRRALEQYQQEMATMNDRQRDIEYARLYGNPGGRAWDVREGERLRNEAAWKAGREPWWVRAWRWLKARVGR